MKSIKREFEAKSLIVEEKGIKEKYLGFSSEHIKTIIDKIAKIDYSSCFVTVWFSPSAGFCCEDFGANEEGSQEEARLRLQEFLDEFEANRWRSGVKLTFVSKITFEMEVAPARPALEPVLKMVVLGGGYQAKDENGEWRYIMLPPDSNVIGIK